MLMNMIFMLAVNRSKLCPRKTMRKMRARVSRYNEMLRHDLPITNNQSA